MDVVKGREDIKGAYQDEDRAASYIKGRFEDPFGAEVHRSQMNYVNGALKRLQPKGLLEIACGPARMTTELEFVATSVAVEQSPAMLAQARQRLQDAGRTQWTLVQGDAFDLQLDPSSFDAVVTFRLIRHFDANDRRRLLEQIHRVLRPGGHVIFDVASRPGTEWLLKKWGAEGSWVDDYLFTRDEFVQEMIKEHFVVEAMHPVHSLLHLQYYLYSYLHRRLPGLATAVSRAATSATASDVYEWVAVCRSA